MQTSDNVFFPGFCRLVLPDNPTLAILHRHFREKFRAWIPDSPSRSILESKIYFAGSYEEVYSIQKTTTAGDTRLPSNRHAGYIVIGFKLLDDSSKVGEFG
ncbi:hypothetical protein ANCDUO_25780 [Ancylostoma duodenale]|uniref:DUF7153 domain-containing protein n=1 Tax=Ancylostoma duodenale TaxID=51022 RepID=A0A0C2FH05_9BILA|nr:hypothetical protein ANCDUO_25780 [Ancylostoma duodenale]